MLIEQGFPIAQPAAFSTDARRGLEAAGTAAAGSSSGSPALPALPPLAPVDLPAAKSILVAVEPVDGRKGIDGPAQVCRQKLAEDPFSGCVFIFRTRRGTSIKILVYDGQGYFYAQKRLSHGSFRCGCGYRLYASPRSC